MSIHANAFSETMRWSDGESHAMNQFWPLLVRTLPANVVFLADLGRSLMGV
ncbi:hypothetical protein D8674_020520 [Pyrus ussuriensis x Pyrus communis]|uniref:Uncharacterized protein n=1 Tax=Pyrus ussuriensis x Pyrus communis TaxID=2448454 RepID=A0A5N5HL78_9ROSA|nr:hypothetical protein D8674_020520 [Pyrus ussuriensis x Pyrus communis]